MIETRTEELLGLLNHLPEILRLSREPIKTQIKTLSESTNTISILNDKKGTRQLLNAFEYELVKNLFELSAEDRPISLEYIEKRIHSKVGNEIFYEHNDLYSDIIEFIIFESKEASDKLPDFLIEDYISLLPQSLLNLYRYLELFGSVQKRIEAVAKSFRIEYSYDEYAPLVFNNYTDDQTENNRQDSNPSIKFKFKNSSTTVHFIKELIYKGILEVDENYRQLIIDERDGTVNNNSKSLKINDRKQAGIARFFMKLINFENIETSSLIKIFSPSYPHKQSEIDALQNIPTLPEIEKKD